MIYSGVDIVALQRMSETLNKTGEKFLDRIATPAERDRLKEESSNSDRYIRRVAAIFALKEAFSKAVGQGIGSEVSFQDLEVRYSAKGQPQLVYTGKNFKFSHLSCSVSHDAGILIAMVVLQ